MSKNIPSDHEILADVNERARLLVLTEMPPDEVQRLYDHAKKHPHTLNDMGQFGTALLVRGFRCDMSRVGFIRRRWERAVASYLEEYGLDAIDSLKRIEADLRSPANAPSLHVERR